MNKIWTILIQLWINGSNAGRHGCDKALGRRKWKTTSIKKKKKHLDQKGYHIRKCKNSMKREAVNV